MQRNHWEGRRCQNVKQWFASVSDCYETQTFPIYFRKMYGSTVTPYWYESQLFLKLIKTESFFSFFHLQEIILKRAADLAEALYSMPRNPNQLSLPAPRSPAMNNTSGFNSYTGQLAVSVQDTANGQWEEGWSHRYPTFTFWLHFSKEVLTDCRIKTKNPRQNAIFGLKLHIQDCYYFYY